MFSLIKIVSDCCFMPIQQFSAIPWREQVNFQWDDDETQLSNSKISNLLSVSLYVEKTIRKRIPSSTTFLQYLQQQQKTLVSMHYILSSTITCILPMILKRKTKNTTPSEQFHNLTEYQRQNRHSLRRYIWSLTFLTWYRQFNKQWPVKLVSWGWTSLLSDMMRPCHSLSRVVVPATLCSVAGTTTLNREWRSGKCVSNMAMYLFPFI